MEFNLRARSHDTLTSVYNFDGDELIDTKTYERCMTDCYMSTLSYVKGAAEATGLDLDSETLERWKRIGNAAYLIDDFLDTAPDIQTACDMYDERMHQAFEVSSEEILNDTTLPHDVDDRLLPAIVLMKNSVGILPPPQLYQLKNAAKMINAITRDKEQCDNSATYIWLLKQEAYHTATLIIEAASPEVMRQRRYSEFAAWCRHAMKLGTLGDSAVDLKDDYEQGITKVNPTFRNIAKIALHAYQPARAMVHTWPQGKATLGSLFERSKFNRS